MLHTYLFRISFCSFGSSKTFIEKSEMLTAAEAVNVTSSIRCPSPSSRGSSSLWVCSLLRVDRSIWHLKTNIFFSMLYNNAVKCCEILWTQLPKMNHIIFTSCFQDKVFKFMNFIIQQNRYFTEVYSCIWSLNARKQSTRNEMFL